MIRHVSNKKIIGWKNIARAWEKGTELKQIMRLAKKISMPVSKDGKLVCIDRDWICSVRHSYVFGRKDIAAHLGKSVTQLTRDMKRYTGLKKAIINPDGKFIFAARYDLDIWQAGLKKARLKNSLDTSNVYIPDKRWEEISGKRIRKCPICKEPIE